MLRPYWSNGGNCWTAENYLKKMKYLSLIFIAFLVQGCSFEKESKLELIPYSVSLFGTDLETRSNSGAQHQNCCECMAAGCNAKKCCSGKDGGNCNCICSTTWYGSSSCNCGSCSKQSNLSGDDDEVELSLNEEQYGVWREFYEIVIAESSTASENITEGLNTSLLGISKSKYSELMKGKKIVAQNVIKLERKTKNKVNKFLKKHNFTDEVL
jgi:hypothetical protein